MKLKNLTGVASIALLLVFGVAGTALAAGPQMGGDGQHMGGDGTPGIHEPGTGMMDGSQHMFPDAAGEWYEQHAQNMAQHGFMQGHANGYFGGSEDITRAQFATVMARMMRITPEGTAGFSDTGNHWAEGQIAAMAHAGIVRGRTDGTFGPGAPITRAQMAAMMDRALQHVGAGRLGEEERTQLLEQLRTHMSDVEGHWAEGHIAHMYGLGITQGNSAGQFRPDEHTNRAQASAMLWRFFEGQFQ